MTMLAGIISLLMAVALPFPAPYSGMAAAEAKFVSGPIISIEPDGKSLIMNTASGPLRVTLTPTSRVLGTDAKPLAVKEGLHPGNYVRVFYVLGEGAIVDELDLLPGAMR